jgi:glycosyltransferase involved in cell wall biosynthesis
LSGAAYATTTSAALSGALARDYSVAAPHVVYNSFPVRDGCGAGEADTDRIDPSIPSITWFSQTIGPGRGLEALIAALELVPEPFEVHIRGAARPGYREALLAPASQRLRARVHFHDRVSQDELARRLAEHDIGYCGELSDCANRDLTITNKVFEYMRAGLAIVASDTAGQVEIARRAPGSMSLFRQGDVGDLSEKLRELVRTPLALAQAKKASRLALEEHFNWRDQKGTIQGLADAALALPANCRSVAACDA